MVKKLLSLVIVMVLIGCCFTGCGKKEEDDSENVTLKWFLQRTEQKDHQLVQDTVNEMLAKLLPNTQLELVCDSNLASKWSAYMASKEPIDIAYTGFQFSMINDVAADSYMELDDLISKYGKNIQKEKEIFSYEYESGVYNNKLYAIPNLQPIMHQTRYISIPAILYQYFPVKEFLEEAHSHTKTTQKMYDMITEYYKKVFDNGYSTNDSLNNSIGVTELMSILPSRGYDWIYSKSSGAYLCYDAFDDNAKIQSFFETDEYKMFCEYAAKWFDAGYIPKDIMVSTTASSSTKPAILTGNTNEMLFGLDEDYIRYVYDSDNNIIAYRLMLEDYDQMFNGASLFGSNATYTVIPFTSQHPERAIKLLDLIRSDEGKDLYNTMVYGIEGKHYTLNGDMAVCDGYTVQADAYDNYGIPHWVLGNVYNAYRTPNIIEGQKEYCLDFEKNVKPTLHTTKLAKFHGDLSMQSNSIAQITSTASEYLDILKFGIKGQSGWKDTYELLISKIKAAGLDDVIKDINKQADEYKK